MNLVSNTSITLSDGESEHDISVTFLKDGKYSIQISDDEFKCSGLLVTEDNKTSLTADINGRKEKYSMVSNGGEINIFTKDGQFRVHKQVPKFIVEKFESVIPQGAIAPMTGTILDVRVNVGDKVSAGDVVAVIYAMKLEHSICAPYDGIIEEIFAKPGGMVEQGEELVKITEIKLE